MVNPKHSILANWATCWINASNLIFLDPYWSPYPADSLASLIRQYAVYEWYTSYEVSFYSIKYNKREKSQRKNIFYLHPLQS